MQLDFSLNITIFLLLIKLEEILREIIDWDMSRSSSLSEHLGEFSNHSLLFTRAFLFLYPL